MLAFNLYIKNQNTDVTCLSWNVLVIITRRYLQQLPCKDNKNRHLGNRSLFKCQGGGGGGLRYRSSIQNSSGFKGGHCIQTDKKLEKCIEKQRLSM